MMKPKITSAHFSCVTPKPKPKVGDRKMIKGILHERKFEMAHDHRGNVIGYNCTGGRQHYIWVPIKAVEE